MGCISHHIMIDECQLAVIIDEYVCPMAVAVAHQEVPNSGVQVVAASHLLKKLQHCLVACAEPATPQHKVAATT